MSAAQHQARARELEGDAETHSAQHDPAARADDPRCSAPSAHYNPGPIRFTSVVKAADLPDCPLVSPGASAQVRSTGSGFAIEIRSDDPASAEEILARAQRLTGKSAAK
jgi:hypothetical protein